MDEEIVGHHVFYVARTRDVAYSDRITSPGEAKTTLFLASLSGTNLHVLVLLLGFELNWIFRRSLRIHHEYSIYSKPRKNLTFSVRHCFYVIVWV